MRIDRRAFLHGGIAAGAGLSLGAAPAVAGETAQSGGTGRILAMAQRLVAENAGQITKLDRAALVDFSLPSWKPRLHLVDLKRGEVASLLVAHGRGSDPGHTGFLQRFSNEIGSNATSFGAYRTGAVYSGKYGTAMRLSGLDDENSNAKTRAIVIHSAWYVGPEMIRKYGKLGRSEGCFALTEVDRSQVIDTLGEGSLLFAARL